MTKKMPVATVGKKKKKNAGYLAVQILSIKYPELKEKLLSFRKKLISDAEKTVLEGVNI